MSIQGRFHELFHDLGGSALVHCVGHAGLGELDRAFEYLEQAVRDHDPNLLFITATPEAMGWQKDPRYQQVLRDIGLGHLIDGDRG